MIRTDRRGFLKIGASAGGLLMVLGTPAIAKLASPTGDAVSSLIHHYVRIGPDNGLTIRTATTEIGQGTNTSIPMLIVEELDYPFEKVAIENFAPDVTRDAEGGIETGVFAEGAGGSTAIWESYDGARQAGARVRAMLVAEAAERLGVDAERLTTAEGHVLAPDGTRLAYGELAEGAASRPLPEGEIALKPRADHRLIGTPQKQKDVERIVRGEPMFGIDQEMDGMLYAVMLRCPHLDGTLASIDDKAALALPGVHYVVPVAGPAPGAPYRGEPFAASVGVIADSHWQAMKGRDALVAEWTPGALRETSSETYAATRAALEAGEGIELSAKGDVAAALAGADRTLTSVYELPMLAHAQLEPENVIAQFDGDRLKIVTPTQQPTGVRMTAAKAAGIEPEQVDLTPVRSGGGFGRRLFTDMIVEAVRLAKVAEGRPVRLLWTRECDMMVDPYRPGGVHRLSAGLDADGSLAAWHHQAASQSIAYRSRAEVAPTDYPRLEVFPDDQPGSFAAANKVDYLLMESAAPRGYWRAPGHNNTAFVQQAFFDEVAEAAGRDPLEFRLSQLLPAREIPWEGHGGPVLETGRLAAVLQLAADKAGWGADMPSGRGRGIAGHFSFGTYVAHVVDVNMDEDGAFSVDRVVSAIDCGVPVNPNGITMQNEGAINDALSAALGQAITIEDGVVQQTNFDTYDMMRIDRAATRIETHIIPSDAPPRGMGEPALPPFAPALANALYRASGRRIRRLPIGDQLA